MTAVDEATIAGRIDFTRGRDWFDPAENEYAKVQVFGAGGIGSWVGLALAKLGMPYVDVIDFDAIEPHNIPNQMYPTEDRGWKADALVDQMSRYGAGAYNAYLGKVTEDGIDVLDDGEDRGTPRITGPVVVSGFDNMKARADLWELVKRAPTVQRYIDGRLAGEIIVVYSVDTTDPAAREAYEATLHGDDEGIQAVCTRQSIIDVGMAVGSWITRAVRRHFAEEPVEPILYVNHADAKVYASEWV